METTPIPSEYLTLDEAARLLRRSRNVLERWARDGKIPAYKVGLKYLLRPEELRRWVDEHAMHTKGEKGQTGTAPV